MAQAAFCLFDIFCLFSAPLMLWLGKQAFRKPTALANEQNERCSPASSHISMHWGEHVTQIWCKDVGHILKLHQPPKRSAISFSVPSYFSTRTASFKAITCFCQYNTPYIMLLNERSLLSAVSYTKAFLLWAVLYQCDYVWRYWRQINIIWNRQL